MKKEASITIAKILCDNHNIDPKTLESNLEEVVAEVYAPFLLFIECLDTKQFEGRNNPFDGFFINMLNRASNTFGGMISLITNGHLQDAEVLSRTLTESSLKIQSLLKGDPEENLSHYLASYYNGQKWKNNKWQAIISEVDIHPHNRLIDEKNDIEEKAKEICKSFVTSTGREWPDKPRALSIEQIFKSLNKEVEYKTVYRAMCGQTHQNQEDLVNSLLYSISENAELEAQSKNEKHTFSIFICLWGMRYFLGAIEALGKHYNFLSVEKQSKLAHEAIDKHHTSVTDSLKVCIFPSGWVDSIIEGI